MGDRLAQTGVAALGPALGLGVVTAPLLPGWKVVDPRKKGIVTNDALLPKVLLGTVQADGLRSSLVCALYSDQNKTLSPSERMEANVAHLLRCIGVAEILDNSNQTRLWPANGDRSMPMRTLRLRRKDSLGTRMVRVHQNFYLIAFREPFVMMIFTGTFLHDEVEEQMEAIITRTIFT